MNISGNRQCKMCGKRKESPRPLLCDKCFHALRFYFSITDIEAEGAARATTATAPP